MEEQYAFIRDQSMEALEQLYDVETRMGEHADS